MKNCVFFNLIPENLIFFYHAQILSELKENRIEWNFVILSDSFVKIIIFLCTTLIVQSLQGFLNWFQGFHYIPHPHSFLNIPAQSSVLNIPAQPSVPPNPPKQSTSLVSPQKPTIIKPSLAPKTHQLTEPTQVTYW